LPPHIIRIFWKHSVCLIPGAGISSRHFPGFTNKNLSSLSRHLPLTLYCRCWHQSQGQYDVRKVRV
jgi:hypothetical protein